MTISENRKLEKLREIVQADGTDEESVNEETWTQQARFLADGNFDALNDYVDGLRAEDGNVVETPDEEEAPAIAEDPSDNATDDAAGGDADLNPA